MKKPIDSLFNQRIALSLGAFGLALLLWIFVVSENEYTMVLDLPIEARNLSAQKAHREEVALCYRSIERHGARPFQVIYT